MKKILIGIVIFILSLAAGLTTKTLFSALTPAPNSTSNWAIIHMKGCSAQHADFEYSMKIPDGWVASKIQEDQYRSVYKLTEGQQASIRINCDTAGVGAVICVNGGERMTYGCFWTSDPNTKGYGAQNEMQNPFGVFVFTTLGVEKSLLSQILSTFQFTQ